MKQIDWVRVQDAYKVMDAIKEQRLFEILINRTLASACSKTFGTTTAEIQPETLRLLFGATHAGALIAVVLLAIATGYEVKGKACTPNGEKYAFRLSPGKKNKRRGGSPGSKTTRAK